MWTLLGTLLLVTLIGFLTMHNTYQDEVERLEYENFVLKLELYAKKGIIADDS